MKRFIEILALFSGLLILLLAVSKAALVAYYPKSFYTANPFLYPIPELFIILISIIFEIFVGIQILRFRKINIFICGLWLLLFCIITGLYRIGVWLYAPKSNCHCFGLIGLLLGSGNYLENKYALYLLLTLLIISIMLVLIHFKNIKNIAIIMITLNGMNLFSEDISTIRKSDKDEQCIVISGFVTFNSWDKNGKLYVSNDWYCFEVYKSFEAYCIKTTFPSGSTSQSIYKDGLQYHLITPKNTNKIIMDAGYIFPSNIAWPTVWHLVPWWIYVLTKDYNCYAFGTNIPHKDLPAPFQPPTSPFAFIYKAEIDWSLLAPNYINEVLFYYDKNRLLKCKNSPFLSLRIPDNIDDFIESISNVFNSRSNHFIAGKCKVNVWTNTEHGHIPLEWEIIQYCSIFDRIYKNENNKQITIANNTRIVGKYHGIATNISLSSFPEFPIPLKRRTTILDFRCRNINQKIDHKRYNQLTYWPIDEEANKEKAVVIKVKSQKVDNIYRVLILSLMLILGVVFYKLWKYSRNYVNKNGGEYEKK